MIASSEYSDHVQRYLSASAPNPLFLCGDSLQVLGTFPAECIDMAITSPPYWGHRQYASGGIGAEENYAAYVKNLLRVFAEVYRVLKPTGSFWLNVGDAYVHKGMLNLPWRIAIAMTDEQRWTLRNTVIWHKVKGGPDNAVDKLRNVYEPLFHFTKQPKGYFYNVDAIRMKPRESRVENGAVVSATGVRGVRYRRQIELSSALTAHEKEYALRALTEMLAAIARGDISDFRMIIRGQQRVTHSDSEQVSGRAKELRDKGFYFLRYHPDGAKPSDVWDIIPEDTQGREAHFAPYPEDICKIPILATCPPNGVVLDPFSGTGTSNVAALRLGRKSIGIDIAETYLRTAKERCSIVS